MNFYIFSFTKAGATLSVSLKEKLDTLYGKATCYTISKYATTTQLLPITPSLEKTVETHFKTGNILIFIGACGIAVRSIAPFLKSKTTDPCVLSLDEKGNFVISLLSGHIGGGNHWALQVASILHAIPVITTATDLNDCFAIDVFAKKNDLVLSDLTLTKQISAKLLNQESVGIYGSLPEGILPNGLLYNDTSLDTGFCITPFFHNRPFLHTLHLIPKQIILGIGCKKGISPTILSTFVEEALFSLHIYKQSVCAITSIDLKKDEPALLALANALSVPFFTYTKQELAAISGDFSTSSFVKSITGVDNVCERASLAYNHAASLFQSKIAKNGCTLAISLLPKTYHF